MMQVILVEDEKPAAVKLEKMLKEIDPAIQVQAILQSLSAASAWLTDSPMPDLIFMDIELGDGLSFELFRSLNISCPVIFVTAYDEYWQQAFEYNGIDYLLKPVKPQKLKAALEKYKALGKHFSADYPALLRNLPDPSQAVKARWLVKLGNEYVSLRADEIAYFYAVHKLVCLVDKQGRKFLLDESLAEIERQVDPVLFFRVSRKYLVQIHALGKIKQLPKSRLQVEIIPAVPEEIFVSNENISKFKQWAGG